MSTFSIPGLALCAVLASTVALATGCIAEEAPPPVFTNGAEIYVPQYYEGYVVYYDDIGRPYYYMDGMSVWVPVTSPYYVVLTDHWRIHERAYRYWYVEHGYRYHDYRDPQHRHGTGRHR